MRKNNTYESFQETIYHIQHSKVTNISFINYVKKQIYRAYNQKQIDLEEQNLLIRYLDSVCFLNGIKV